jgi:maleylacetate reductase
MNEFHYVSYAQEVIFSSGAFERLKEPVERSGNHQYLMVCTSKAIVASGQLARLEAAIGSQLVAVFDRVKPHIQDIQVNEAIALATKNKVDGIIGFGGGSSIGMAKAVAAALSNEKSVPVLAIPTTYAGSEMTATYGITNTTESPQRKVTFRNPRVAPKLVIYDPSLFLELPQAITASTSINALAHCIEALYSVTSSPLSGAVATSAIRYINTNLLSCYKNGNDMDARTGMLIGAHLAGISLASVSMGLHHGLCHVLGGSANVPHGIANSIILPYAIRFNARTSADELIMVAKAIGISKNGQSPDAVVEALAQKIYDLIGQMNLPQQLRDVGIKESDLPTLAQIAFQNQTVQNNPQRITDAEQIERLLREAW